MKKIIFSLLAIYLSFITNIVNVNAGLKLDYKYLDDGFNDGRYLDVCEYENTVDSYYNKITIYYFFNKNQLRVSFYKYPNISIITDLALDDKGIYTQEELFSKENSSCPKYAFANFTLGNEVCFSSDEDYCLDINGSAGFGKKFKGKSECTFDFADQIKIYYSDDDNYFYDVSCENFDLTNLENKLVSDFSENFLRGNALPSFIENNKTYQIQKQKQADKIIKYMDTCTTKIIADENMTDEKKNELLKKFNYSEEDINDVLLSVDRKIQIGLKENNCKGLFGINKPGYPAYYIFMAFNIIKYLAILILIVFTISDYLNAIVSKEDDSISKSNGKFLKRFFMVIIIFFLPLLLETVMEWSGLVDDVEICGITNVDE